MPKLDLTRALRIKSAAGELQALKGPGFAWTRPAPPPAGVAFVRARRNGNYAGTETNSGNTGSLAGVAAGNSLVLVIHSHAINEGAVNIAPTITGGGWTQVAQHEQQGDGWGNYRHRLTVYVRTGVAAGAHNIAFTFPVAVAWSAYLVETTGAPTLDAFGAAQAAYQDPPLTVGATTTSNPTAGDRLVIAGAALTHNGSGAAGVPAATGYTDTVSGSMNGTYFSGRQQYKAAAHAGTTPETWSASRSQTSYGYIAYVAVFR